MIRADDIKQAVFGVSDGITSALGVVIPLALTHQPMLTVIMGLAICAAIGMGGGEWLSDKKGSLRSAIAMAAASFVGTVIPALPFFLLPYSAGAVASSALCAGTLVAISEVKGRELYHNRPGPWTANTGDSDRGPYRRRAYAQTFGILGAASAATVAFAFATGAAG